MYFSQFNAIYVIKINLVSVLSFFKVCLLGIYFCQF